MAGIPVIFTSYLFLFLSKHDPVAILNKNKPRQLPTGRLQECFKKTLIVTAVTTPWNRPVFQGHKLEAQKLVGGKKKEIEKKKKGVANTPTQMTPIFNPTSGETRGVDW